MKSTFKKVKPANPETLEEKVEAMTRYKKETARLSKMVKMKRDKTEKRKDVKYSAPITPENPYGIIVEGDCYINTRVNGYYLNQIDEVERDLEGLKWLRRNNPELRKHHGFIFELEQTKEILETLRRHFH